MVETERNKTDDISHKQSWFYRFLRNVVIAFTKPMKTVWEVPFDGKPAVFVCNHDRAFGPMAMCAHFELSENMRPWINAQVLSPRKSPEYIRHDYWWDLSKWYSPILGHTLVYLYALILPLILHGSDCIPVYHDTSVISTLRRSIEMLRDGKHILIFPEHPTGFRKYGEKIFDGFVSIGRLYYSKTKEIVNFYPVNVDWKEKTICVGRPIPYDPSVKYDEQVLTTAAAVEEYFDRFKNQQKTAEGDTFMSSI